MSYHPDTHCADCAKPFAPPPGSTGTGYATLPTGARICYACCAVRDRASMDETGRAVLYLSGPPRFGLGSTGEFKLTNWPGTLTYKLTRISKGRHNLARTRYDVWFRDHNGNPWHGVNYGEFTQLTHCRRVKHA